MIQSSEQTGCNEKALDAKARRELLLELIRHNIRNYCPRDRAIFELSFYTTITSEELVNLNKSDIDITMKTVSVKRGNQTVYMHMTDTCATILEEICLPVNNSQNDTPLFLDSHGERISLSKLWFIKMNITSLVDSDP